MFLFGRSKIYCFSKIPQIAFILRKYFPILRSFRFIYIFIWLLHSLAFCYLNSCEISLCTQGVKIAKSLKKTRWHNFQNFPFYSQNCYNFIIYHLSVCVGVYVYVYVYLYAHTHAHMYLYVFTPHISTCHVSGLSITYSFDSLTKVLFFNYPNYIYILFFPFKV